MRYTVVSNKISNWSDDKLCIIIPPDVYIYEWSDDKICIYVDPYYYGYGEEGVAINPIGIENLL